MVISDAAQLALLQAQSVRIVPLIYIATTTPVRIALSFGTFAIAANTIDSTGGDYLGIGDFEGLPSLNSLINGTASRIDLSLSAQGTHGDDLAAAIEADTSDLMGARVSIGFALLDEDYQPEGTDPTFWLWSGNCDKTAVQKQTSGGIVFKTISISVGSIFVRRKQGQPAYYTDFDQKQRSATDEFCSNVKGLSKETTKPWPV